MSLPGITGLYAEYFGDAGGATVTYYYVQPIFPSGRGLISQIAITVPAARSQNNIVLLKWDALPGATGYDVMTNLTGTNPTGTQTCGLQLNTWANAYTDRGRVPFSYTTIAPS